MINYRDLLKRYINEVGSCEGVCFIPKYPSKTTRKTTPYGTYVNSGFTQEELNELNKLANEEIKIDD